MSVWAIMTPVLILGTIFSSIANTAQAAIISLAYSVFVTVFIYKTIKLEEVLPVTMKSSYSMRLCHMAPHRHRMT